MKNDLDMAVEKYGKRPYHFRGFFKLIFKKPFKIPYILPSGWPLMMLEHERQFLRGDGKPVKMNFSFFSMFIWLFKTPHSIFFYIPVLGWIPLIIRMLKKKQ